MVCSSYVKQRILFLKGKGKTYRQIIAILNDERYSVTKAGISGLLNRYEELREHAQSVKKMARLPTERRNLEVRVFPIEADDKASRGDLRLLL